MNDGKARRQRILVTGSSGCIGGATASRLSEEGRTVVGMDIRGPDRPMPFPVVTGSVSDVHLVHRLFNQHGFDAVIHCGGISGAAELPEDPFRNCETNIFGTVHLLETARIHRLSRFVFCSSSGAYGETASVPVTEDAPLRPVSVYGATKAACDGLVRAYRMQHGLDGVSLRIGRVYGPGRRTRSIVRDLLQAAVAGQELRLAGRGGTRLQYVYVDDVVTALCRALDAEQLPLAAYNLSGPGSHADDQIAGLIAELVPSSRLVYEQQARQLDGGFGPLLDFAAAERDLDYRPRSMELGLQAFLLWMRSQQADAANPGAANSGTTNPVLRNAAAAIVPLR